MIDEKMLAEKEDGYMQMIRSLKELYPDSEFIAQYETEAETIRNARRYLALREHGVLMGLPHNLKLVSDGDLDAAADRLLEGGE